MKLLYKVITLLLLINALTIFPQQPSSGEVIKFDSLIQDEPRIKFSKGVDESVAPTTGSLTVKVTAAKDNS